MDDANIVSALQEDLQNYKVKIQIRRKESQLHVLITRTDGDDLDYASLYDIVKRRIDQMPIAWADSLIMYGRLSGAKHPEWQRVVDIRPPLPLIELDLDELEEFGELEGFREIDRRAALTSPLEDDEMDILVGNLKPNIPDDFESQKFEESQRFEDEINNIKIEDFNLGDMSLGKLELDNFEFDLDSSFTPDKITPDIVTPDRFTPDTNSQIPSQRSPIDKNAWIEEDFGLDEITTVARPLPLPPTRRSTSKAQPSPTTKTESATEIVTDLATESITDPENKPTRRAGFDLRPMFPAIAISAVAIAVLGICGWLIWNRSVQQQYLTNSQNLDSQNLNPTKITKLDALAETRNQLQTVVSQLEEIPDRPASLYPDAQKQLAVLRPKLEAFDRKVAIEQVANKQLESAKNGTLEAAKLSQNPPHISTIWKSAKDKRQQALKMLEDIPPESILYVEAQNRLKVYRTELVQINKWVEIQQRAESVASNINPDIVNQLKQLKAKVPDKQQFLPQCKIILQPQIPNSEAQKLGFSVTTLTEYLCAYFGDF